MNLPHVSLPIRYVDSDGEGGTKFGYECPPLPSDLRLRFDQEARIPAQVQAAAAAAAAEASESRTEDSSVSQSLRQTFIPITELVEPDHAAHELLRSDSKFGGKPFLLPGEEAGLRCACGQAMSFWFQLNGHALPSTLRGVFTPAHLGRVQRPMFQFWLCLLCLQENVNPEEGTFSCRWIDASAPSITSTFTSQQSDSDRGAIPLVRGGAERRLTGWTSQRDLPDMSEAEEVWGIEVGNEWEERGHNEPYPLSVTVEKLSGFPKWGNNVEYTHCAVCGARRELFFQIHLDPEGSEDEIFYSEAMVGWGSIQVCPIHRDDMSFVFSGV